MSASYPKFILLLLQLECKLEVLLLLKLLSFHFLDALTLDKGSKDKKR